MWNCLHVAQAGTNQKFHTIDDGTTRERDINVHGRKNTAQDQEQPSVTPWKRESHLHITIQPHYILRSYTFVAVHNVRNQL